MTFLHWLVQTWATTAQASRMEDGAWAGLHQEGLDCPLPLQRWLTRPSEAGQELLGTQNGRSKKKQAYSVWLTEKCPRSFFALRQNHFLGTKGPPLCAVLESTVWDQGCVHRASADTGWAVETGLPDTRTPTSYLLTCFLKEFRVTIFKSPLG